MIIGGNKVDGGGSAIRHPLDPHYTTGATMTFSKGDSSTLGSDSVERLTNLAHNIDYVWVALTTKANYKWPKSISATTNWEKSGDKIIRRKWQVLLKDKEISITNLWTKKTLEDGRWNGVEGVVNTM